ncbi:MFS transporter [Haloferax profundi]|uniref:MFS transporter n=1 Tax=Haloferax profundi TaxID=1544718 RepID=A0A0W1SRN2_9EURY|nr:MFS transporter [Haloferax profundi]KTG29013.1 MFS transporter [Haloferax profundi]
MQPHVPIDSDEPDEEQTGATGFRYWAPLITVSVAMFIGTIDSSMMNVAVPAIVSDLNTDVTAVQGAISFYGLVMASLMLPAGRVATMYGLKRIYALSLVLYGLGTLLAAISWNMGVLFLGWSVVEGVAAAVLLPLGFTLVVINYEGKDRAMGLGLLAGVSAAAAALGPIFGGILTTFFTWRYGFAGEFILALVALALVPFLTDYRDSDVTLDWVGALLSSIGIGALVLGFILGGKYGWIREARPFVVGGTQVNPLGLSPTVLLVAGGGVLLVAFVHWQFRRERRNETPLVPMRVLNNGGFVSGVTTWVFRSVALAGFLFVVPLFLQSAVGFTAFESGVALLPFSIAGFVFALGTTGWRKRIQPKYLVQIGTGLMIGGLLLLYGQTSVTTTIAEMLLPMAIVGTGLGLVMAQIVDLTLSSVADEDVSEASSTLNATGMLGYAIGTAVFGSALLSSFYRGVVDGVLLTRGITVTIGQRQDIVILLEDAREIATEAERQAAFAALSPEQQQALADIVQGAMVSSMELTLLFIVAVSVVMLAAATFLPTQKPTVDEVVDVDKPSESVIRADD